MCILKPPYKDNERTATKNGTQTMLILTILLANLLIAVVFIGLMMFFQDRA